MKQEHGFSSALSNCSDAFADLLDYVNGRLTPSACLLDCSTKKTCVTDSAPYLAVMLADALLAKLGICSWFPGCVCMAYVRLCICIGTVTSHAIGLSRAHGNSVMPSGRLPSCCSKLTVIIQYRERLLLQRTVAA